MLTKATVKLVQSLKDKKSRRQNGLFVVEGSKTVGELLASKIAVKSLFATQGWLSVNNGLLTNAEVVVVSGSDLAKMSSFSTPPDVLAVASIPSHEVSDKEVRSGFSIALDTVQDPGNMGTIIRIADWYGITSVICSPGCADVYNPKVLQSTMGSFLRVRVVERDLDAFFRQHAGIPVYGAVLDGQSLYQTKLSSYGILLVGNEGNGIGEELQRYITVRVTIPRAGAAESLNAAVAAGILCDARARSLAALQPFG